MKKIIDITLLLLIFGTLSTKEVNAYLDPGSSSYLLQILFAGFFSMLLVVKTFWKRIALFIKRILGNNEKTDKE